MRLCFLKTIAAISLMLTAFAPRVSANFDLDPLRLLASIQRFNNFDPEQVETEPQEIKKPKIKEKEQAIQPEPMTKTAYSVSIREIKKDIIASPQNEDTNQYREQLLETIDRLSRIKIAPAEKQPEPVQEPVKKTVEATTQVDIKPDPIPETAPNTLSPETLTKVDQLIKSGKQYAHASELAAILYNSGNLEKAAYFYKQALDTIEKNSSDYAWTLYQIGNCLRKSEPAQAIQYYTKLTANFPDLFWAEIAAQKKDNMQWKIDEQIENFMAIKQ